MTFAQLQVPPSASEIVAMKLLLNHFHCVASENYHSPNAYIAVQSHLFPKVVLLCDCIFFRKKEQC